MEEGLYEQLVTDAIAEWLDAHESAGVQALVEGLDPSESGEILAQHLRHVIGEVLRRVPTEERVRLQIALANEVIDLAVPEKERATNRAAGRGQLLREIRKGSLSGATNRPLTPLNQSALLVNAPREPKLASELFAELESADSVDLLCAFVVWTGVRVLRRALEGLAERKVPFRVITTTYMGATEPRALELLEELGADIRVSYETRATRLHAKAWLFERKTGFSTAYIGSSNLSHSALHDGLEWNVRISQSSEPLLMDRFRASFETYWQEERFEPYERDRFRKAIAHVASSGAIDVSLFDIKPYPYQERMLYELEVERERHGRWQNLVVAATGTGKTVLAALDYKRVLQRWGKARLLFVAHRKEILDQSLRTFRHVLKDGSFGELFVGRQRPDEWQHVFASIQSLSREVLDRIKPDQFDVVIVDEFHHAKADSYERLLKRVQPKLLLGLTATPERADGKDVTEWFDGRIAVDLRLWDAIDEGLLCPFQYFGIADETDLSELEWKKGGYDLGQLEDVYTGNDARVAKILKALNEIASDPLNMRALGFCVSIKHAEFMAKRFSAAGIPSLAVSGKTNTEERDAALRHLKAKDVNVLFAVDLYNEGVDVPEIDAVLFLRPTESITVFLQQLGRGLRKSEGKSGLTVLDFIGQQHRQFRFDLRFRALTGASRSQLATQIDEGFPFLPSGCHIQLDRISREVVLNNVRQVLSLKKSALAGELKATGDRSLGEFLSESGLELEDVYRAGGSWTQLRRQAGLSTSSEGPREEELLKRMWRVTHVDDLDRLVLFKRIATDPDWKPSNERERRLFAMLHYGLLAKPGLSFDESRKLLTQHPAVLREVDELMEVLDDRAGHLTPRLDESDIPLDIHARYRQDEVLAAMGQWTTEKSVSLREGVRWIPAHQTDLFFVTLNKVEQHYSPTTMYRDYAISPELFHWESQSTTSEGHERGQRYINHQSRGSKIFIFARINGRTRLGAAPYLFLGPANYVSHTGSRPMAITWRLNRPMPPDFFQQARAVA